MYVLVNRVAAVPAVQNLLVTLPLPVVRPAVSCDVGAALGGGAAVIPGACGPHCGCGGHVG